MLNEQNCDHLIAIRLSAWNQFVVLVGSPIGNNADMPAHCSKALSEFPVERARSQWVWKPNFLFSHPSLLRLQLYQCQSWIRTARLCVLPWPWRSPVWESKGEVLLLPCEDVSVSARALWVLGAGIFCHVERETERMAIQRLAWQLKCISFSLTCSPLMYGCPYSPGFLSNVPYVDMLGRHAGSESGVEAC